MRFFVTGEHHRKVLIKAAISMFLVYILLFAASSALMFFHEMDLSPQSVVNYYLGDEEHFRPPKSYESLLEVSHAHLFAQGMLMLTLVHLMLMAEIPVWLKVSLGTTAFFSAVLNEAAGWLVRFVHPNFAYLKVVTFLTLEASLSLLVLIVGFSLLRRR